MFLDIAPLWSEKRFWMLLTCIILVFALSLASPSVKGEPNVIIGTKTGIPADATIKKVTFDRSGDDLVTTFQVKGSITNQYSYQIAIVLYEKNDGDFAFKILTYPSPISTEPQFYIKDTRKSESIHSKIERDTWTAWTPLSLMNYRAHFWVWIGVGEATYYSGSYTTKWIDLFEFSSTKNFEITLPVRLTVRLQPSVLASQAKLKLDGSERSFDTSGECAVMIGSGVSHEIEVSTPIQTSQDTRYVLSRWSDNLSAKERRSISLDSDGTITLSLSRQFLLTVSSTYGTAKGGGWYDEAATATATIEPTEVLAEGILGMLGVRDVLVGWTGSASASGNEITVTMDGPKTVTATWRIIYSTTFFGFVAAIICIPILLLALLWKRRQRTAPAVSAERLETPSIPPIPPAQEKPPTTLGLEPTKHCLECGLILPMSAKICPKCGTRQSYFGEDLAESQKQVPIAV